LFESGEDEETRGNGLDDATMMDPVSIRSVNLMLGMLEEGWARGGGDREGDGREELSAGSFGEVEGSSTTMARSSSV